MLTGMLAVRNACSASGTICGASTPTRSTTRRSGGEPELGPVRSQVFAKLDRGALGTAVGGVSGALRC